MNTYPFITEVFVDYDVIIVDFDGTVVDSIGKKNSAFAEVFSVVAKGNSEVQRYINKTTHLSREERLMGLATIVRKIEGGDVIEIANRFRARLDVALASVYESSIVSKALIDFLSSAHVFTAVSIISAAPQIEIKAWIKSRQLESVFQSVTGAPSSKVKAFANAIQEAQRGKSKVIYVGDTNYDFELANRYGCDFMWSEFTHANIG